jgi:hypothetical protein
MEIVLFYTLFAVTTAFAACYQILFNAISTKESFGEPVPYKWIMYISFFCISVLIAPIVFLSCINPSMCDRFRKSIYQGMFPQG